MTEKEKRKINLYKIVFSHSAPKDTEEGIKGYILAHNDVEVYECIDKEFNNGCWKDTEADNEMFQRDGVVSQTGGETFREKIIRLKGEINDEDFVFDDAYYGIKLLGWELVAEDVAPEDFSKSIELGIIKLIEEKKQ